MSLDDGDRVLIPPQAVEYIERTCGPNPLVFEVIEAFFAWLSLQDKTYIFSFLKKGLG